MKNTIQKITSSVAKIIGKGQSTSLSDSKGYTSICLQASQDEDVFKNFRRDRAYNEILEHTSEAEGAAYLKAIEQDSQLLEMMQAFQENDLYGNPMVFEYPRVGKFSPTTLRYIKVLHDLLSLFKSLNKMSICEIGVGYGGQCRIICSYNSPLKYSLVDIDPALKLAGRYLKNFDLKAEIDFLTMDKLESNKFDLVISNYAFTELRRPIQDVYLQKIILSAHRGYITYNDINPPEYKSYKKEELLEMIPGSRIIEEKPLTYEGNCIIIWGME